MRLLARDPTLAVVAFAVWSALLGISLLWPGDILPSWPSAGALLRLRVPEEVWGSVMLVDAALLLVTLPGGDRPWLRAAAAAISGGWWTWFGAYLVAGAWGAGVFPAVGGYAVCAGFGLLAATVQWASHEGDAHVGK